MKKSYYMLIVAMVTTSMLSGCLDNGSTADPPTAITATAGDGRVLLTWTGSPGVDYWLFTATDPGLTAFNWTSLPNAHAYLKVATPFYMCGLFSGSQYYFAMNGRKDGGPGGPSSPTITTTIPPYNASSNWLSGSTGSAQNLYGVGYTSLTTCSNNATSATGSFAAVGAGGAIFTSPDGMAWSIPTNPPLAFSSDLYAVTGYAATLNSPNTLRWVAVGAGGASVYSADGGATWSTGNSSVLTTQPLHSITQAGGTFVAVGDGGTILSTTDGITWTIRTSGWPNNLLGVTHGTNYIAVGDGGIVLTSADGSTWTPQTYATTNILREVAAYGSIIVAVGDSGTIVTSKDSGSTWTAQSLGAMNLVGVAAESQFVEGAAVDPQLGYVSTTQFVAVDDAGKAYTSVNGITWSLAINTNIAANPSNLGKPLVSSGFGYAAVGNGGATAYAF